MLGLLLAGCSHVSPFVEYEHVSDPNVGTDGFNLVCVGGVGELASIEISLAPCKNVSGYGGEVIKFNARKVFR